MFLLYRSALLLSQKVIQKNPVIHLFFYGYFLCTLLGWLLLQLPFCQKEPIAAIDTLFMTASATSTTGLSTVDIEKTFSLVGQQILLLLIQLGGAGYLILSSFIVLSLKQKMLHYRRKNPFDLASISKELSTAKLVKQVIAYTAICEVIGAIALYAFLQNEGLENPLWSAMFHSVSTFCTAGLSLFSTSFESYQNHVAINITLSLLSLLGAFGFFFTVDFFSKMTHRGFIKQALRIVKPFATTAILLGSFLFLVIASFPRECSEFLQLIVSFFLIISAITTTGYSTIDLSLLPTAAYLLLIVMMLIGVTLTGNGLNMKNSSFATLLRLCFSLSYKKNRATSHRQNILLKRIELTLFTFLQYLLILLIASIPLAFTEELPFLSLLFETASALSTVGLSIGITAQLSVFAKSLLIFLMVFGKIGVLIFGFALSSAEFLREQEPPQFSHSLPANSQ